MPVVDWTRTDLDFPLATGATALRFDHDRFAAFDLYVLKRDGAQAQKIADALSQSEADLLTRNISAGLPGATTSSQNLDAFRARVAAFKDITPDKMRANVAAFLEKVVPVAAATGARLTLHPDDPPRALFGLPRIASTAADYQALFDAVPSKANGICLCTGSLGVRAQNDLAAMARQFAPRIAFAHLRATKRDEDGLSFIESDHLDGDVDMITVLKALLAENRRRSTSEKIVFRPDHGHRMLDDLAATKRTNPGYTAIGRLRGLA